MAEEKELIIKLNVQSTDGPGGAIGGLGPSGGPPSGLNVAMGAGVGAFLGYLATSRQTADQPVSQEELQRISQAGVAQQPLPALPAPWSREMFPNETQLGFGRAQSPSVARRRAAMPQLKIAPSPLTRMQIPSPGPIEISHRRELRRGRLDHLIQARNDYIDDEMSQFFAMGQVEGTSIQPAISPRSQVLHMIKSFQQMNNIWNDVGVNPQGMLGGGRVQSEGYGPDAQYRHRRQRGGYLAGVLAGIPGASIRSPGRRPGDVRWIHEEGVTDEPVLDVAAFYQTHPEMIKPEVDLTKGESPIERSFQAMTQRQRQKSLYLRGRSFTFSTIGGTTNKIQIGPPGESITTFSVLSGGSNETGIHQEVVNVPPDIKILPFGKTGNYGNYHVDQLKSTTDPVEKAYERLKYQQEGNGPKAAGGKQWNKRMTPDDERAWHEYQKEQRKNNPDSIDRVFRRINRSLGGPARALGKIMVGPAAIFALAHFGQKLNQSVTPAVAGIIPGASAGFNVAGIAIDSIVTAVTSLIPAISKQLETSQARLLLGDKNLGLGGTLDYSLEYNLEQQKQQFQNWVSRKLTEETVKKMFWK